MTSKQKLSEGIGRLVVLAGFGLMLTGCASSDVNPQHALAKTGYVDLHSNSPVQYTWQVSRFDAGTKDYQQIYSSFDPPKEGMVRLALAPGPYRLKVELLNRLTTGPLDVVLEVEDGKITPVRLTVAREGSGEVETVETSTGGTLYGRYGRNTKISDDAEAKFKIGGTVEVPLAYRLKAEMPYAQHANQ